jgi:hypothetical protein
MKRANVLLYVFLAVLFLGFILHFLDKTTKEPLGGGRGRRGRGFGRGHYGGFGRGYYGGGRGYYGGNSYPVVIYNDADYYPYWYPSYWYRYNPFSYFY